ncbi:hypothetical protein RM697_05460 [Ichthyenterobacterium sp. W332]|uniref:Uncharacterized protein n=1 Tax=Microcosmobacter mediterraneus TaxID=3075607 RepID=A0ABU2YIS2_9FLAO|nr:hypothetical protein [Ichthyenterobacterium sp. W332]MDT0558081.1 hypothetical protein [Ichthyenterobacterium sp. W332]
MASLSAEDIRFIDNYLDNSDVIYQDIRMEMVDHVASAIETQMANGNTRDFYYIFKDYMVKNKARLLDNNKKFLRSADMKIAKLLFSNLLSLHGIVTFALLYFGLWLAYNQLNIEVFKTIISIVPFMVMLIFGLVYFIALKVYKLERFSIIERIAFPFVIIFHLFSFSKNLSRSFYIEVFNILLIIGVISLIITLIMLLFKITVDLAKIYRKRFNKLV